MHVSLSELASTVAKACVAVGIEQGNADAIADVARFASRYQLSNLLCMAQALQAVDEQHSLSFEVQAATSGKFVCVHDKPLSALSIVAPLRDTLLFNNLTNCDDTIFVRNVDQPQVALLTALTCGESMASCIVFKFIDDNTIDDDIDNLLPVSIDSLCLVAASTANSIVFKSGHEGELNMPMLHSRGVDIEDSVWKTLDGYAKRLLVPATDSSRLTGAGAGLVDND